MSNSEKYECEDSPNLRLPHLIIDTASDNAAVAQITADVINTRVMSSPTYKRNVANFRRKSQFSSATGTTVSQPLSKFDVFCPFRCHISIRALLGVFLIFVVVSNAILVWLGVTTSEESTTNVVSQLRESVSARVIDEFSVKMQVPLTAVTYTSFLYREGILTTQDIASGIREMMQHQVLWPYSGHYIGTEHGIMFGYFDFNATYYYVTEKLAPNDPQGNLTTYYSPKSAPLKILPTAFWTGSYNTNLRPWYVEAKQNRNLTATQFSSIYVFAQFYVPGITATSTVYDMNGTFIGVAAVDLDLSFLSSVISDLFVGGDFVTYIVDGGTGVLVAASQGETGGPSGPVPATNSSCSLIASTASYLVFANNYTTRTTFNDGGTTYWVDVHPLYLSNLRWYFVTIIAEDEFLSTVHENETRLIVIACCIGGLCFVLAIGSAYAITRPLAQLEHGMNDISLMKFSEVKSNIRHSNITEVSRMSQSFEGLIAALESFSKFIPTAVIRNMMASHKAAKPGLINIEAAVFFMDIADFTTICEVLPPDDLVEMIGQTFEHTSEIVVAHDGTIDKYIGDSLMAFWNAPEPVNDFRYKCVKASLECKFILAARSETYMRDYGVQVNARIGLQGGSVHVGNFGSIQKLNYTVIGDVVNQASRFESLNKLYASTIIAGGGVVDCIRSRIIARHLDDVRVKGKANVTSIYEVLMIDEVEASVPHLKQQTIRNYIAQQQRLCDLYERAHSLYRAGKLEECAKLIESDDHSDAVCVKLAERCTALRGGEASPDTFDPILTLYEK